MPREHFDLELRRDEAPLERGWQSIEAFLRDHGCAERVRFIAALVFEEAVSNIFERAQPPPSTCRIEIGLAAADELVMRIIDDGVPFNPCEALPPQRPTSIDDAPDGGRGIWLMRKMSRSMKYARIDGCNQLEIHITGQPADKDARPDRDSPVECVK